MKYALLCLCLGLWTTGAQAGETEANITNIPEYYSFSVDNGKSITFSAPSEVFAEFVSTVKTGINLLAWVHHQEAFPSPRTHYDRVGQFGTWINDSASCLNTRAQILVRDSKSDVSYQRENHCLVSKGQWTDPYAGDEMTKSQQVQIDHVVPLKNAYTSGASKWDAKARCLYANFTGTKYNLLSVDGHENMSKGDSGPEEYMPPKRSMRCEYIQYWLKIKATWNLVMTKDEASSIQKFVKEDHCQEADLTMSAKELHDVRAYIQEHLDDCGS